MTSSRLIVAVGVATLATGCLGWPGEWPAPTDPPRLETCALCRERAADGSCSEPSSIEQIEAREAGEGGRIRLGLGGERALWVEEVDRELSARCEGETSARLLARVDTIHRIVVAPHLGVERFAVVWMDDEGISAVHMGCDDALDRVDGIDIPLDASDLLVAAVDAAGDLLVAVAARDTPVVLHVWRQEQRRLVTVPLAHEAVDQDIQVGLACTHVACRLAWTEPYRPIEQRQRVATATWGAGGVERADFEAEGRITDLALAPDDAGWRLGWAMDDIVHVSMGGSGVAQRAYLLTEPPQDLALTSAPVRPLIATVGPAGGLTLSAPRADAPGEVEVVARASAASGYLTAVTAAASPARIRLAMVEGNRHALYEAECR